MSLIDSVKAATKAHVKPLNPKRWEHIKGVAHTAERLAKIYGVNPEHALLAGYLHDFDKVATQTELLDYVERYQLAPTLLVAPEHCLPILHSFTMAARGPELFPEVPACVWQAVARHTIPQPGMSELDCILFIADLIEPNRGDTAELNELRNETLWDSPVPLQQAFMDCLTASLAFMIHKHIVIYPSAFDVYNEYAQRLKGTA